MEQKLDIIIITAIIIIIKLVITTQDRTQYVQQCTAHTHTRTQMNERTDYRIKSIGESNSIRHRTRESYTGTVVQ